MLNRSFRPRNPIRVNPARLTYRGFLWVKCPYCGEANGFSTRNDIDCYFCRSCRKESPLKDLKPLYVTCECGKRYKYMTNLTEAMADIPCLNCGAPVPVMRNVKSGVYETIRQQPRRR